MTMPHDESDRAGIRRRFLAVDTANISDVLEELDRPDQGLAPEFRPVSGDRLAGWAYPIRGEMATYEGSGDPTKMTACQGIGPDEISVWSGGGRGVCYFGELIAVGMMQRGSAGALVDGGVRDTRMLREHGFAVFATYVTPVQSIGRWRVTDYRVVVDLPGATADRVSVAPGDFVAADSDGAIVIPAELVKTVLTRVEAVTAVETEVRAALRAGLTLNEALERYGHV
jgi:4-hydroxy-4-methyl-2-oxoglutarate aldolase